MAAHHIKTSHSPSRCSIPQAPTGDARQWQHTTSKPTVPHLENLDARFHKCPLETHISGSTPHQNQPDPSRHSIPQVPTETMSVAAHNIKTSHSPLPSRRSIPQAPTGDAHQWQHTTSKPTIPHLENLDARFHKCPLETHISGSTPHQKPAIPHLDAQFHKCPLETHVTGSTPHQNQAVPI